MDDAELARMEAHIHSLGDRLSDTARFLKGIAAVVEGMNRGATDRLQVAIHAVEAVAEDLSGIHAVPSLDNSTVRLQIPEIVANSPASSAQGPAQG